MLSFSHSISLTRKNLLRWKSFGAHPLDQEIKNIEKELQIVEAAAGFYSDPWLQIWFRALSNRYSALLRLNSIYWGQRARMLWLSEGDRNSKFFHSFVKIRRHKNKVHAIHNSSGTIVSEHSEIESYFLDFFFF